MRKIIISSVCLVMLCSCGLTKKDLGLEKNAPDEMMVVSRAPLSIPPEFGLRPIIVDDNAVDNTPSLTAGERAILEKMK
ncbi:MAG: DUF3035 domain-containing protein [Alphaproteobacteria bacterium]|nr:DUF3035 domain-containing protein [Alphaproteobacteria bacterium]